MIRAASIVAVIVLAPAMAHAADPATATGEIPLPPPSYDILRFNEDYSCLSNPAMRTDWFDPIKYIPLRIDDPTWYLTFGGELRERFEAAENPGFGVAGSHDQYWLQRITLLADVHLGEQLRFFVEGISGLEQGESLPAPPPQKDLADLQFAFVDLTPYLDGDERLTLRIGRYGMSLGSGRLVATRAAPNIPFKFDGLEMLYAGPRWEATAFLNHPVNESTYQFDGPDYSTTFWGLYVTHWFDAPRTSGLDFYYLGIHREHGSYASGDGDEHRHSLGARLFGEKDGWDWNGESLIQFGSFGNDSILAWTASMDAGYTLDVAGKPRFGVKADATSGNRNPGHGPQGTFDALYFKSGYFNDASLLRPENIIDIHPNLTVNPSSAVTIDGGVDVFWRYSRDDGIYAPAGYLELPAIRAASPYVGTALDVNLEWRIQKHVTFSASYVYMFTGSYVHAAHGGDVNYVSATMSFLF